MPRLSHQWPVLVEVVVTAAVVALVVVVAITLVDVVVVVVVVVVEGVVDVVVVLLQDAKTSDITMIQVSTIQIVPLFIYTS